MKPITKPAPGNASNDWNTPKQVFSRGSQWHTDSKLQMPFWQLTQLWSAAVVRVSPEICRHFRTELPLNAVKMAHVPHSSPRAHPEPGRFKLTNPTWTPITNMASSCRCALCTSLSREAPIEAHFPLSSLLRSCKNQQTMELSNPAEHKAF